MKFWSRQIRVHDQNPNKGHAELLGNGSIAIIFDCHTGDEATLKARRDTSATTC